MYTNGQVIIKKHNFTIEVVTAHSEIIYILKNEEEACEIFMALIFDSERK